MTRIFALAAAIALAPLAVAAQDPGRHEQPHVIRQEQAGGSHLLHQPDGEAAAQVHEERAVRELGTQPPGGQPRHDVAQPGPEGAPEADEE